jgi:hypothetical protein
MPYISRFLVFAATATSKDLSLQLAARNTYTTR